MKMMHFSIRLDISTGGPGMKINCPKCGQTFDVEAHFKGKSVKCSRCNEVFVAKAERKCPMCGKRIDEDTVMCIACGTHLVTGRQVVTRHEADQPKPPPEEDEEEAEPTLGDRICMAIGVFAPGLFKPGILIVAALLAIVGFAIIVLSIVILKLGAGFAGLMIAGAGLILYAQGVAIILSGEFSMLPDAMLEFDTNRWCVFIVLIPVPFVIMFALIKRFAAA